jgi:dephospho-CoA kinase
MPHNHNIPFRLGVTGGIGSGKTSVCRVFSILGVPVFSADASARDLMESESKIRNGVNAIAGSDLYHDGSLDRKELARLIFGNKSFLERVNALVHPEVFKRFNDWCTRQESPYVIMEAAIIFESGAWELLDRIAIVTAPAGERITRVMKRNNLSEEQVLERMNSQAAEEDLIRRSHYVIKNGENDMIIPAILKINEEILNQIKWHA